MDVTNLWKKTELFVIDVDGTFRHGQTLAAGALEFIQLLKEKNKDFIFFTNNSSQSPHLYLKELNDAGCALEERQVVTTADVAIHFLKTHYSNQRVYVVGSESLCQYLEEKGILLARENWKEADLVLVTFDKELTYDKLAKASQLIQSGAVFLATHEDRNCPVEGGFIPDCGSILASIVESSGMKPKVIGKPNQETIEMIMEASGKEKEQITFIGDRLETDIAIGANFGANTVLVYGGASKEEDIVRTGIRPDMVCQSLDDFYQKLKTDCACI